jgi:hypothetical protein
MRGICREAQLVLILARECTSPNGGMKLALPISLDWAPRPHPPPTCSYIIVTTSSLVNVSVLSPVQVEINPARGQVIPFSRICLPLISYSLSSAGLNLHRDGDGTEACTNV